MAFKEKPVRGSTPSPDHIMLSISDDAKTTMTVTWRTSTDVPSGYTLCKKEGSDEVIRTEAISEIFESDIDISYIHWAKITSLEPGTKYYYTCGDDSNRSDEFYFETEPENLTKFKFIAISDHQKCKNFNKPDYSELQKWLNEVLEMHPDTRFILTGGDNCDCGQHEVQWNGMFSGLTGIIEHVPYMMTLGNHDNRGFEVYSEKECIGRYYSEPAEFFGKQFKYSYPYNGPKDWKTENYSFNYGNCHFVVYGINGPEDVNEWSLEDHKSHGKTWTFGAYHFPIYYSGPELSNDDAYPMMRESMEKCDILFSGHEHNFSRSYPIKNEELFDKPSQGTIHYMLGNGHNNPPGSRTLDKVWHCSFYPQEEYNQMVAIVEVDGNKVTMTSVLNDGRIVDECIIDKDKDDIFPHRVAPIFKQTRLMFKGVDLGLCMAITPPEEKDGVWYAPMATMVSFIGGLSVKEKSKVTCEVYGHKATFFEGSDVALADGEEFTMNAKVYRGKENQLYIPIEGFTQIFGMKWAYAKRNNFISVEYINEDKPVTVQP